MNRLCPRNSPVTINMQCKCFQDILRCGHSPNRGIQRYIRFCMDFCQCGGDGYNKRDRGDYTGEVPNARHATANRPTVPTSSFEEELYQSRSPFRTRYSSSNLRGHRPLEPSAAATCPGSCTSVNRGCSAGGSCTCFAPPISPFFWFRGACGPRNPSIASLGSVTKRDVEYRPLSRKSSATKTLKDEWGNRTHSGTMQAASACGALLTIESPFLATRAMSVSRAKTAPMVLFMSLQINGSARCYRWRPR